MGNFMLSHVDVLVVSSLPPQHNCASTTMLASGFPVREFENFHGERSNLINTQGNLRYLLKKSCVCYKHTKRKNHSAYGTLQESPVLNDKTIERGEVRGASSVSGKRKVKRERKKTKFSRTQSSAQKRYLWWTDVDSQCEKRRKGQEKREEEEESQKVIYCKACLGPLYVVRRGDPSCASCCHLFFCVRW